jgi:hypothetical protein
LFQIPPPALPTIFPFWIVKYSTRAVIKLFTVIPRRADWPSMIELPVREVKPAFQPPYRLMLLLINTTSDPEPVYVPLAMNTESPSAALPIAPLIVAQGEPAVVQEFKSLPVVATNHTALLRLMLTDPAPLAEAETM